MLLVAAAADGIDLLRALVRLGGVVRSLTVSTRLLLVVTDDRPADSEDDDWLTTELFLLARRFASGVTVGEDFFSAVFLLERRGGAGDVEESDVCLLLFGGRPRFIPFFGVGATFGDI